MINMVCVDLIVIGTLSLGLISTGCKSGLYVHCLKNYPKFKIRQKVGDRSFQCYTRAKSTENYLGACT